MKKYKVRLLSILLPVVMCMGLITGCGSTTDSGKQPEEESNTTQETEAVEKRMFTDDCGRQVELPVEITRIAGSGTVAQMILMTIAPELMVGVATAPTADQLPYLPDGIEELPEFGQFYGGKTSLNLEALLAAEPQLIIDLGEAKDGQADDMDMIQEQTGIPAIFIEADVNNMERMYKTLGMLLGREEQGDKLAEFARRTIDMAAEKSVLVDEEDVRSVYYGTGPDGLSCNAAGSSQSQVIDIIGARNAIVPSDDGTDSKRGGTIVSLEELYSAEPDVILLTSDGPFDQLGESEWSELGAVKNGEYYRIPSLPFNWTSSPPSVNMLLGVWWMGRIVYPDIYNDYDMVKITQEYYSLFWHCDLTEEEAAELAL